jgi:hypothetical protein
MTTLRETAVAHVAGKKDITTLDRIPVDCEVKIGKFQSNGKEVTYSYVEIEGYKYSIKGALLDKIKQIVVARPQTKFIKAQKTANGDIFIIPLD